MLKGRLNLLLADERKAPRDYSKVIPLLKRKSDKEVIRMIQRQERHHAVLLNKIKRKY